MGVTFSLSFHVYISCQRVPLTFSIPRVIIVQILFSRYPEDWGSRFL